VRRTRRGATIRRPTEANSASRRVSTVGTFGQTRSAVDGGWMTPLPPRRTCRVDLRERPSPARELAAGPRPAVARARAAHSVLSIRRRGSSSSGKTLPFLSLGMPTSRSPAGVDSNLGRCPLRCAVRVGLRTPWSAPIVPVSSASISSCRGAARMSAMELVRDASVPCRRPAISSMADSYVGHRVEPLRVGAWRSARWPAYIPEDSAGLLLRHHVGLTRRDPSRDCPRRFGHASSTLRRRWPAAATGR
jgi:hypothetical protein